MDEDFLGDLGLLVVVGSFDELAALERGAGADERDEMGCVDRAPACLGGFDELERWAAGSTSIPTTPSSGESPGSPTLPAPPSP